jgi:predicted phosphodiesterase
MRKRHFILTAVFTALALPAQEKIVGGPFAVNVTGRSATIGWVVQTGEVKIAGIERGAPILRGDNVSFTSLKPGVTLEYEVPGRPELTGSFQTAPAAGATFEAVVFGDTRTRHELHRKVIESVMKSVPDVAFHTGDLVTDGQDSSQWPTFFDIEAPLLKRVSFFPVLGNHERNSRHYHSFFEVKSPYYSVQWGSAMFFLLNTDLGNLSASPAVRERFWDEQTRWLESELKRAEKAEFRFVVAHNPPMTAVKSRQAGTHEVQKLPPLLEKYKVHAMFCGHDHNYQHHLQNGVHYVVTGGGGAPLYPVDAPMEGITQKVISTEHHVRLKVEPGKATLTAIGLDGAVLDQFEMK